MSKKKAVTVIDVKFTSQARYERLRELVKICIEGAINESLKNGDDPSAVPVLEARYVLAQAELERHIQLMEREDGE